MCKYVQPILNGQLSKKIILSHSSLRLLELVGTRFLFCFEVLPLNHMGNKNFDI